MKAYVLTGSFLVSDLPKGYLHHIEPGSTIEELEMEEYPERIEYNSKDAVIMSGSDKIQLVPQGIEAVFAEVMFGADRGDRVSWDIIADTVDGLEGAVVGKVRRLKTQKRIKDARIRLNEKILTAFGVVDYFEVSRGDYSRK